MNQLTQEIATVTQIRNVWGANSIANGLTPQRLAGILSCANSGDLDAYLTLAEEMEERDPHYSSVLRTRKLAVSSLTPTVEYSGKSEQIAESVRNLIKTPEFNDLLDNLLDALGKGYSVSEIIWQRGKLWKPKAYVWRDPRFFMFHQDNPEELRLVDEKSLDKGIELPDYKFIIHKPKLKSGLTMRGGLARLVAFSYVCKSYGTKDWLAFAEIYGIPMRIGKYGKTATDKDIRILKKAVQELGTDGSGVIPESMLIEFLQVSQAAGGSEIFARLVEWIDRQVSKAVLGQTMTVDDGSSQAQAKVHNEVRQDIIESDAKQLANTINRDLIRPFVDINFGVQDVYPNVVISIPETEDLAQLADNLAKLIPLGLRVDESEVRAKLGLSEPSKDSNILGIQGNESALNSTQTLKAINSQFDPVDDLESEMLGDWEAQMSPIVDPILQAIQSAQS